MTCRALANTASNPLVNVKEPVEMDERMFFFVRTSCGNFSANLSTLNRKQCKRVERNHIQRQSYPTACTAFTLRRLDKIMKKFQPLLVCVAWLCFWSFGQITLPNEMSWMYADEWTATDRLKKSWSFYHACLLFLTCCVSHIRDIIDLFY